MIPFDIGHAVGLDCFGCWLCLVTLYFSAQLSTQSTMDMSVQLEHVKSGTVGMVWTKKNKQKTYQHLRLMRLAIRPRQWSSWKALRSSATDLFRPFGTWTAALRFRTPVHQDESLRFRTLWLWPVVRGCIENTMMVFACAVYTVHVYRSLFWLHAFYRTG